MISDELREYAEVPDRYALVPSGTSVARFDDGRICVLQGATWASISGPRFDRRELEDVLALVHELVPAEKRRVWWIGPGARPRALDASLLARGFTLAGDGPEVRAMVLTTAPPELPAGVDVRRIETYDDFAAAREVQWDAFAVPEDRRTAQRDHMRTEYGEAAEHGIPVTFLASLDGRPAATGMAIPSARGIFLVAGATASWARGRGLYRALVRARWDYAVEQGTPALVTDAIVATSYPILQRIGFEEVCTIWRYEEPLVEREH